MTEKFIHRLFSIKGGGQPKKAQMKSPKKSPYTKQKISGSFRDGEVYLKAALLILKGQGGEMWRKKRVSSKRGKSRSIQHEGILLPGSHKAYGR